jgi:DNA-binding GntR family transcriptional regulator
MGRVALISQTAGPATDIECARLALNEPTAPVLRVTRIRHDKKDRPLAYEHVVLPLDHFPGLAGAGDVIANITDLAKQFSLSLDRATEQVSIVRATSEIAHHLGIAEGAGVLKLDRVIKTRGGESVEWRVAYAPDARVTGDHFSLERPDLVKALLRHGLDLQPKR